MFSYRWLKKVLETWGKCYGRYFDALTKTPEVDYVRVLIYPEI